MIGSFGSGLGAIVAATAGAYGTVMIEFNRRPIDANVTSAALGSGLEMCCWLAYCYIVVVATGATTHDGRMIDNTDWVKHQSVMAAFTGISRRNMVG